MGPTDEDKKYAQECFDLVKALNVSDVEFTGRINVRDYLGKMDFTLLTSISEGSAADHSGEFCGTQAGRCNGCRKLSGTAFRSE